MIFSESEQKELDAKADCLSASYADCLSDSYYGDATNAFIAGWEACITHFEQSDMKIIGKTAHICGMGCPACRRDIGMKQDLGSLE